MRCIQLVFVWTNLFGIQSTPCVADRDYDHGDSLASLEGKNRLAASAEPARRGTDESLAGTKKRRTEMTTEMTTERDSFTKESRRSRKQPTERKAQLGRATEVAQARPRHSRAKEGPGRPGRRSEGESGSVRARLLHFGCKYVCIYTLYILPRRDIRFNDCNC
ncbi:hypothetical protein Tcan_15872 [Toxocara canis]|uniref:Secreted protein n=1 Tax=Toxocara canis TaxID=6265 RepID=A0A0B2W0U0_TOXCA|nr:hypothetical protein Tcan_15872 [Toxocara canis]